MSSTTISSKYDTLETAYQIGKYIQSFGTDDVNDQSGKPWSNYRSQFKCGPNPYFYQTKKGLILQTSGGKPDNIHTPYGMWRILSSKAGDWEKVFEAIKEPLGLELFQGEKIFKETSTSALWIITKWEGKQIEMPEYKKTEEYIPYEKVKEIWNSFIAEHKDLKS